MIDTMDLVREFHEAFDIPVNNLPTMPRSDGVLLHDYARRLTDMSKEMLLHVPGDDSGLLMRLHLCTEELGELAMAMWDRDAVEALDALCDMRYMADSAVLTLGFGAIFDAALAEVHASNMSKLVDGKPVKSDAGRVQKPDTYFKPNLEALLKPGFDGQQEPPNAFREAPPSGPKTARGRASIHPRNRPSKDHTFGPGRFTVEGHIRCDEGPPGAPRPADTPPWGIHSPAPEDAPPAPPLGDDGPTYSFGAASRGLLQHHIERNRLHLAQIANILDSHLQPEGQGAPP